MYTIKLLNKIAQVGLDRLPDGFAVDSEAANPDGILVRSAAMHDMVFGDRLLAIARAGAGTNNIPLKRLVGFDYVNVPANGTTVVEIPVKLTDLAFFNEEKDCFEMTPGEWQIWVARSSDLNAETDLVESFQISTAAIREDPEVLSVKPTQPGDENLGVSERVIFQMSDDESKNIVDPGLAVTMTNEKIYGVRVINNVPGIDIGVDADAVNAYTATTAQGWTVPDSAGKVARLETGKSADELPKVGTKFVLPADYKESYASNRPPDVQVDDETEAGVIAEGTIVK